jgi:hypothetical protein
MSAPDVPQPMGVIFHDIRPDAFAEQYGQGDELTFTLFAGNDRAIVPGTICLEGSLQVTIDGTFADALGVISTQVVYLDPSLGVHGLIRGTSTATEGSRQIENIGAYAKGVRMIMDGTRATSDLDTKIDQAALIAPLAAVTTDLLEGVVVPGATGSRQPISFSFAPHILLNKASGPIAFARTGAIRVSFRLARKLDAFFGPGALDNAAFDYRIQGARLRYNTVPVTQAPAAVVGRSFMTTEHTLASQVSTVTTIFPSKAVDSFTMAFRNVTDLANPQRLRSSYNNDRILFDEITVALNDAINGPITKPIRDEQEALRLGLMSLGGSTLNGMDQHKLGLNDAFLLGYPLGQTMDVTSVPFTVSINSPIINQFNPFILTTMAHVVTPIYMQAQA